MAEDEQLVAEQTVAMEREQAMTVRISQHPIEDFYRVAVNSPASPERYLTATVSPGDNFMMNLIEAAIGGEQVAWRHLASWGRDNLPAASRVPRRCFS